MNQFQSSLSTYTACRHIKKKSLDIVIDEETIKSFTSDCNVLPLFEKKTFDYTRMRHYSLHTNEALNCAWRQFLSQLEGRQRTPFQFPKANDIHFYKYNTCYEPSQSLNNRDQLKLMVFGQGGQTRGYAPVPNEMHTRKTAINVRKPREGQRKKWKKRGLRL